MRNPATKKRVFQLKDGVKLQVMKYRNARKPWRFRAIVYHPRGFGEPVWRKRGQTVSLRELLALARKEIAIYHNPKLVNVYKKIDESNQQRVPGTTYATYAGGGGGGKMTLFQARKGVLGVDFETRLAGNTKKIDI